ncbi:sigma-70 family RNA polymerase sigma factor [Streptomyces sp. NPDC051214]|uniref:RNA polymerase sigma factor n=1 Tax=Streptomyces sp. NPDC051214 TaxID=3155282 RepID=UPI003441AD14
MSAHEPAEGTDRPLAATSDPDGDHAVARQQVDAEFSAFYRATVGSLTGFLINQGAGVYAAADIAQEAMIDAYRHWANIRHAKAWVHKAASRALVRKVASVEEPVPDVPEPTSLLPHPDRIADWEVRHDALLLVRALPPRQRQVLAWALAGFTPCDIADHLGLPADTVRANLKRARRNAAAAYRAAQGEEER